MNITNDLICQNLSIRDDRLYMGEHDLTTLAQVYGTPLYVMDEDRIRDRCRTYLDAVREAFGAQGGVYYASKACSFKQIYRIMSDMGMGIDVVSPGEISTAKSAGFDMTRACYHSNNKTDEDIRYALSMGVGVLAVDSEDELRAISSIASDMGRVQDIYLRITPGIDPHTYSAVATGKVDSKFGSAIETGQAMAITSLALSLPSINLIGYHCHVGSQVFDSEVYLTTAGVMLDFIKEVKDTLSYTISRLDLGGGYGVRYTSLDKCIDIRQNILSVANFIKDKVASLGIDMPAIYFEPGRSIVADSGVTLYTVGSLKHIPGYKNYVSVDGGMTDNPRYALYSSRYTLLNLSRLAEDRDMLCSVVGRCCESGDIIQPDVYMPSTTSRGDIVACLTTGAYNYSMASNYNRVARPPVVMLKGNEHYLAVKRESWDKLHDLDI